MVPGKVYDIIFFVFITVAIALMINPKYNGYDEISYMGIMLEYEYDDINIIHEKVYDELRRVASHAVYDSYTNINNWRSKQYYDISFFESTLNYHRAKPLYTWLSYSFYKLGVSLSFSTTLTNIISMWLMLLIFFLWVSTYVPRGVSYIVILCTMMLSVFTYLLNMSIPDALANMLVLLSLYLISRTSNKRWVVLCLTLAVLARVDNCIITIVIVYFLFKETSTKKVFLWLCLSVLLCISAFIVPILLGNDTGWIMNFAFLKSFNNYVGHLNSVYTYNIRYAWFVFHAVSVVLVYIYGDAVSKLYAKIIAVSFVLHVILFPSVEHRFFVAYEYCIVVMLFRHLYIGYKNKQLISPQKLRSS